MLGKKGENAAEEKIAQRNQEGSGKESENGVEDIYSDSGW